MRTEKEQAILQKLLAKHNGQLNEQEISELKDLARSLAATSSRHHYIPQYYIKGFTALDGLVSVYDKQYDIIKSVRVGANGIFYERDRNSVEIENLKLSFIEDYMFSDIDNLLSITIKKLRELNFSEDLLCADNQGIINAFVIDLFWRNPVTDYAFEDMYARSTISFTDEKGNIYIDPEKERSLRSDVAHRKVARAGMALNTLNHILSERIPGHVFAKLWEFESDFFVLGDYPVLFRNVPGTLTDLITMDFLLPISKNRMYANQRKKMFQFTSKDSFLYNALIIDQSATAICGANKDILEKSVKYYHELKRKHLLAPLKEMLFEGIAHNPEAAQ